MIVNWCIAMLRTLSPTPAATHNSSRSSNIIKETTKTTTLVSTDWVISQPSHSGVREVEHQTSVCFFVVTGSNFVIRLVGEHIWTKCSNDFTGSH